MPIIECDKCHTQFNVIEEQIGMGRIVRCCECKNTWYQKSLTVSKQDSSADFSDVLNDAKHSGNSNSNLPDGVNPTLKDNKNALLIEDEEQKETSTKLASAFFITLLLLSFAGIVVFQGSITKHFPQTSALYSVMGLKDTSPLQWLRLENVYATYRDEAEVGEMLFVQANIKNIRDKETPLVGLKVSLLETENGEPLQTWTPAMEDKTLSPGEIYEVKLGFTDFVKADGHIKLDLIHKTK